MYAPHVSQLDFETRKPGTGYGRREATRSRVSEGAIGVVTMPAGIRRVSLVTQSLSTNPWFEGFDGTHDHLSPEELTAPVNWDEVEDWVDAMPLRRTLRPVVSEWDEAEEVWALGRFSTTRERNPLERCTACGHEVGDHHEPSGCQARVAYRERLGARWSSARSVFCPCDEKHPTLESIPFEQYALTEDPDEQWSERRTTDMKNKRVKEKRRIASGWPVNGICSECRGEIVGKRARAVVCSKKCASKRAYRRKQLAS